MTLTRIAIYYGSKVFWLSIKNLSYSFWGIFNRVLPFRFASLGSHITFSGWVRIDNPLNNIEVKSNVFIGRNCYMRANANAFISIGERSLINDYCYLTSNHSISIESDVLIGEFVSIRDYDHAFSCPDIPISLQGFTGGPIVIGEGSWIGRGVAITKNVRIGKGCIIGANSVVTRDIPDYSVAVGSPAKVLKTRA
jgi:acetyltransferase-like isoleucine patch superfamily enzyme